MKNKKKYSGYLGSSASKRAAGKCINDASIGTVFAKTITSTSIAVLFFSLTDTPRALILLVS